MNSEMARRLLQFSVAGKVEKLGVLISNFLGLQKEDFGRDFRNLEGGKEWERIELRQMFWGFIEWERERDVQVMKNREKNPIDEDELTEELDVKHFYWLFSEIFTKNKDSLDILFKNGPWCRWQVSMWRHSWS